MTQLNRDTVKIALDGSSSVCEAPFNWKGKRFAVAWNGRKYAITHIPSGHDCFFQWELLQKFTLDQKIQVAQILDANPIWGCLDRASLGYRFDRYFPEDLKYRIAKTVDDAAKQVKEAA